MGNINEPSYRYYGDMTPPNVAFQYHMDYQVGHSGAFPMFLNQYVVNQAVVSDAELIES